MGNRDAFAQCTRYATDATLGEQSRMRKWRRCHWLGLDIRLPKERGYCTRAQCASLYLPAQRVWLDKCSPAGSSSQGPFCDSSMLVVRLGSTTTDRDPRYGVAFWVGA